MPIAFVYSDSVRISFSVSNRSGSKLLICVPQRWSPSTWSCDAWLVQRVPLPVIA